MKFLACVFILSCGLRPPMPAEDSGELRAIAQKPGARIVWFGAHPDDETLLSGALWSLACQNGAVCEWFVLTEGAYGACSADSMSDGSCPCPALQRTCPVAMAAARVEELTRAAKVLGASLHIYDTDVAPNGQAMFLQAFQDVIAEHPDVIITHAPTGGYGNSTHRAIGSQTLTLWQALPEGARPILAQALDLSPLSVDDPPVTDTILGSETVNGRRIWDRVQEALALFTTQIAAEDALDQARACDRSSFRLLR